MIEKKKEEKWKRRSPVTQWNIWRWRSRRWHRGHNAGALLDEAHICKDKEAVDDEIECRNAVMTMCSRDL
jgi:hypothetical protein